MPTSLGLSSLNPVSRPLAVARGAARLTRTRLADWWRGETAETFFDLHDLPGLNALLLEVGGQPLTRTPPVVADPEDVIRYVLGETAARRCSLTSTLDRLTDHPQLSAPVRSRIREIRTNDPAARARRVYELREDLRGVYPLGLTPKGRGAYLRWMLTHGRTEMHLTAEAALWYLFELDAEPCRGLSHTFRLQPDWQAAVPHGLTRFGWSTLKDWLSDRFGFESRWLRTARLVPPFRPTDELTWLLHAEPALAQTVPADPEQLVPWATATLGRRVDASWLHELAEDVRTGTATAPGVNVLGFFRYTSGLQQAVRGTVDSLARVGVRTTLRDFPVPFLREPRNADRYDGLELHDVTVLNTGIDVPVEDAYRKSGWHRRAGVYRVGMWWWELETVPTGWLDRGQAVDEIWAPTRFIADALGTAYGKPVFTMNPGVELPAVVPVPKSYFGLAADRFTFGYVFDMNSRMQRKNPLALIEAFRRAFTSSDRVQLALKVSPPESYYADQWQQLRDAVRATPNVVLVDRVLSRADLLGFLGACDCYTSLHRSEGFGLTCAESLLLGKPVIATGYSGNVDFMTDQNSYLVRYEKVRLEHDIDPYPRGAVWAEPDVGHAAELMRQVFANPAEAAAKGEQAKHELAETLSVAAAGRRMRTRLEQIRRERGRV